MANENGSSILISRILSDADAEAEHTLADAAAKAVAICSKAEAEAARLTSEGEKSAKAAEDAVLDRMRTNAELESRKYLLKKKRELISRAFCEAEARFKAMPGEMKADFFKTLIIKECEGGEVLRPCAADRSVLSSVLSGANDALKAQGKAPVTLGEDADIDGGFLLCCGSYEKNCSLKAVFGQLTEDEQHNVAELLFGEGA